VRRAPLDRDRRDRRVFVALGLRLPLRAAAVLPGREPPELIVDLRLAEGSSVTATEAQVKKLEKILRPTAGSGRIDNFVSYVGSGSPRFYLPFDQQLVNANFGQFIINTKGSEDREVVRARLLRLFEEDFTEVRGRVNRLENGPRWASRSSSAWWARTRQ
jgi:multidrug efflux pump